MEAQGSGLVRLVVGKKCFLQKNDLTHSFILGELVAPFYKPCRPETDDSSMNWISVFATDDSQVRIEVLFD